MVAEEMVFCRFQRQHLTPAGRCHAKQQIRHSRIQYYARHRIAPILYLAHREQHEPDPLGSIHDVKRFKTIFAPAPLSERSADKNARPATITAQIGAGYAINDRNSLEFSQGVGSRAHSMANLTGEPRISPETGSALVPA